MTSKKTTTKSNKKPAKAQAPKKSTPVKPPTVQEPLLPVEDFLMHSGIRPHQIGARAAWAKSKGYTLATVSFWRDLFKTY